MCPGPDPAEAKGASQAAWAAAHRRGLQLCPPLPRPPSLWPRNLFAHLGYQKQEAGATVLHSGESEKGCFMSPVVQRPLIRRLLESARRNGEIPDGTAVIEEVCVCLRALQALGQGQSFLFLLVVPRRVVLEH